MNPAGIAAVLVALVVAATLLGLAFRTLNGRAKRLSAPDLLSAVRLTAAELGAAGIRPGNGATLLQFSSALCSRCPDTARVLGELATQNTAVQHVEVDVAKHPQLVSCFNVMQTPTTLILDAFGTPHARIGGAVRRDVISTELARVLAQSRTAES